MPERKPSTNWIVLIFLSLPMMLVSGVIAMPISDYKEKMNFDERWGYLSGGISALTFQYAHAGNRAKGICVNDWFFRSENGSKDMVVEMMKAQIAGSPVHVENVMLAVIKKKCGHLDQK